MNNASTISKYGKPYNHPEGMSEDKYYEIMYEFIDLAKSKGLTVRQAQYLFTDCSDAVLETKMGNTASSEELVKYNSKIIESLQCIDQSLRIMSTRTY